MVRQAGTRTGEKPFSSSSLKSMASPKAGATQRLVVVLKEKRALVSLNGRQFAEDLQVGLASARLDGWALSVGVAADV
jgi:hypothetical protein